MSGEATIRIKLLFALAIGTPLRDFSCTVSADAVFALRVQANFRLLVPLGASKSAKGTL